MTSNAPQLSLQTHPPAPPPPPPPPPSASASTGDDANPRPKKRRRRHLVPPPEPYEDGAAVLPEELAAGLLTRAIAAIAASAGFQGAVPLALEELRQMAENYYVSMLSTIQHYTLAARRSRPTVLEFEDMLRQHRISLSSLLESAHPPPASTTTALTPFPRLPPPSPPPPPQPDLTPLLGEELRSTPPKRGEEYLPALPSKHTYSATPVYASRPTDPRQIRELATGEARLAENALRNIMAATHRRKDGADAGVDGADGSAVGEGRAKRKRDDAWRCAWERSGARRVLPKSDEGGNSVQGVQGQDEEVVEARMRNGVAPADGNASTAAAAVAQDEGAKSVQSRADRGRKNGVAANGGGDDDGGYLEVVVNADNRFLRKSGGRRRKGKK